MTEQEKNQKIAEFAGFYKVPLGSYGQFKWQHRMSDSSLAWSDEKLPDFLNSLDALASYVWPELARRHIEVKLDTFGVVQLYDTSSLFKDREGELPILAVGINRENLASACCEAVLRMIEEVKQ